MAYSAQTETHSGFGFVEVLSTKIAALRTRYAQFKVYRTTLSELQALSGRDLADLGIHKSMIKRIAMEAAYGK